MATATVEKILEEITELSPDEQQRLRQLLEQQSERKKELLGKFVEPIPEPDQQGAMRWLADHRREYEEQWVALDGYRLIAHGTDFDEVCDAADADGAYLPMITFIEKKPERPFVRV